MRDLGNWVPMVLLLAMGGFWVWARAGRVAPARAQELVAQGALLVDVRSPAEFASGHLPGARNVPLGDVEQHADALRNEHKPVVLYCASGTRSALAASRLRARGLTEVYDLGPGSAWPGGH